MQAIARKDPKYIQADEFSRDQVLSDLVAKLQAEQNRIDPETATIVMKINGSLEDYSRDENGFPVSIFTSDTYLNVGHRTKTSSLFFRN